MLEDMQLRGLSARTQQAYARAVWQLAQHYHRSPDQLSEEELRQYFLYLTNEKKLARPTATIALCGIKFFYQQTLKQDWPTLRFVRPAAEHKLPVILSWKEVGRVLAGGFSSTLDFVAARRLTRQQSLIRFTRQESLIRSVRPGITRDPTNACHELWPRL